MTDGVKKSSQKQSGIYLLNIKSPKRARERLKFSFQRISAMLTVLKDSTQYPVSLLLVDISESGCGFFSSEQFPRGTIIELMIHEPRLLRVKGAVVWSTPVSSGMDSSNSRTPFRCGVQFMYGVEMERENVREFCTKLKENVLKSHAKMAEIRTPGGQPENFVGDVAPSTAANKNNEMYGPPEPPPIVVTGHGMAPSTATSAPTIEVKPENTATNTGAPEVSVAAAPNSEANPVAANIAPAEGKAETTAETTAETATATAEPKAEDPGKIAA